MIQLKVRRILKRIQGIALWVLLVALVSIVAYLRTRTVFDTLILVAGFFVCVLTLALMFGASKKTAKSLGEKTKRASREELEREDDVLLQAVAFSQSVLFIFLNLIPGGEVITAFRIIVPFVAVPFYVLRAWGKIKNNAKYRYWSIWLFFFIILNTIFALTYAWISHIIDLGTTELSEIIVLLLYFSLTIASMQFIEEIFKKRYGYQ